MELYQLRSFVAVAEAGHVSRAAERLFVSQPAVSAHIKALEEELGVGLFTRSARGMALTAEGRELLVRARAVLEQAAGLERAARSLRQELSGELKVALNTDPIFLKVRELLELLRAEHPKLAVHLPQSMSNLIIDDVRAGRLDAGFAYAEEPPEGLACLHLACFRLAVAGPPAWRERLCGASWAELSAEPWVWYSDALPCHAAVRRAVAPDGACVRTVAVTDYEGTIKALVQSGAGLGIMRLDEARACEEAGQVFVWPGGTLPMNAYFLARPERAGEPALRAFEAVLRRVWNM